MSKPGSNCRCFVVTTIWVSWDHTSQKECQASLKRNGVHHDSKLLFLLTWDATATKDETQEDILEMFGK